MDEIFDPFGTLGNALWIGGAQWAGKSTVARLLTSRYGLTAYHCDYQDARGHHERWIAHRVRHDEPPFAATPDQSWLDRTPAEGVSNSGWPGIAWWPRTQCGRRGSMGSGLSRWTAARTRTR